MTAHSSHLASSRVTARLRATGAIVAVAALAALVALGPPGRARAATNSYDQITGIGQTDSGITVPWTQGLLDNTNTPLTASGSELAPNASRAAGSGEFSFMYGDFQNLKVSVSQTQNITHQGITVTWTGGQPTASASDGSAEVNFLQMMECYGDSASGPDPTQCEYGTGGLLDAGTQIGSSPYLSRRTGDTCPQGSIPAPPAGMRSFNGDSAAYGCDPAEPGVNTPTHLAPCPGADCGGTPPQTFDIPFAPADGSAPIYHQADLTQYFNQFDTNEVQEAVTAPDGTGQQQFETFTTTEAPGLGCGALESDGQPRDCWLVIVPRGQYEPNGYKVNTSDSTAPLDQIESSPLSAGNWAMRIQIHLGFAPVQSFCPIGTQERETIGTEVIARAVQSWQLALNKAANCSKIFGYSAVPEATSTQQLALSGSGIGLAFTTIPIGSEATRGGGQGTANLPPLLYAPVGVSAVGIGFNINDGSGYITTPVKLTPQLLARALTQNYRFDLPDYYPVATSPPQPGPTWSQGNPFNITFDHQFLKLNAGLKSFGSTLAPLLTEDHSALNQQIWQWIQADPSASAWLDGTPDPAGGVTVDPDYQALSLGKPPAIDSFPRAYSSCLDLGLSTTLPQKEEKRCSLDLLPYTNNYEAAGAAILTGNIPFTGSWAADGRGPDGTDGWWGTVGIQPIGKTFAWGISDTPDLAAFGLIDAQFCNDDGSNCVAPSIASVTAALNSAKPDSAGLLQVDPSKVGGGGYPLVQVTYAAVPTNQDADALNAYADLIAYAAGPGQTPGVAPGDLPPGYLPMPANLQAQALSVVGQLRADASGQSASPSPTSSSASGGTTSGGSPQPGGSLGSGQATGSSSPPPYNVRPPGAVLASSTTQRQPVGPIRWALLVVVIVGAACAVAGTVLRGARVPRWLHRARP